MLNNTGHIDAKLIDFSEICRKKSSEIGCFLLIVSWRSFPPKISHEIGRVFLRNFDFFRYNLWNWPICLRILTFLPRNRLIFPRILTFFPRKSHKIDRFFREFAPKNPTKFCFFSAKYQKLWKKHHLCENLIPVHWLANNMTSQADVRLCKLGSS